MRVRNLLPVAIALLAVQAGAHKNITSKYTYNDDVFPILSQRCGQCHVPGGVAPMSLLSYKDALPWAESMRLELTAAHMPPWYAENGFGDLAGSHRLSPRELDILLTWATGGTPEGPVKRLPAVGVRNNWKLGRPDLLLPMLTPFTLGPGKMEGTQEFVLQKTTVDRWIRAVDVLPGAPAMVRSASIYIRTLGPLGLWLPGDDPVQTPAGSAFKWPAGTELILRVQYRKTWTYEDKSLTDRSTVGLYLASAPVQEVTSMAIGPSFTLIRDVKVVAFRMEDADTDQTLKVEAVKPDGTVVPLIRLTARPDWNRRYWFAKPVTLSRGTEIRVSGGSARKLYLDVLDTD